jgi:RNA polymerase sigma factor (TIGR02999 family)
MPPREDTTDLLRAVGDGDREALDRLMPRMYDELHAIAHRELARRRRGAVLRTTGLLHEAYLKLVDQSRVRAEDRSHFLALSATAMRHILIDHARSRATRRRGGDLRRISLADDIAVVDHRLDELIELDDALARLERFDPRLARVVECRFFGGLTVQETASALGMAPRTVDRAWQKAKGWLYREINEA